MSIEIRHADDRFVTDAPGITTYHSFSYGAHYDATNVGFGPLVALNDEHVGAGAGYDDHRHAATDIVTWVLEGALHHRDSLGHDEVLPAGTVALARTGSGITHAEMAPADSGVRFLQFMLRPERVDVEPSYEVLGVCSGSDRGVGCEVAGGRLQVGLLDAGPLTLPDADLGHLFVVDGHVVLGDRELGPGDEARLVEEPGRVLTAEGPSRVAVWSFT